MSLITASAPPAQATGVSTSATCYVNVVDNTADTITVGGTTVGVEIINDSLDTNVAINFVGTAAIPTNTANVINNHLIRPKEARYFQVAVTSCSIIAASGSQQVRVTFYI